MILAGASADDVFVIVLFTSLLGIAGGGTFDSLSLMRIPSSILLGIAGGIAAGYVLHMFLSKVNLSSEKTLILFLSMGLVLGSVFSFIILLSYIPIIAKRIKNEEEVLSHGLKGYEEYKKKVRYKVIPFIW
jgi:NhaP-type Na+/H+ or K+/H+ antiporter